MNAAAICALRFSVYFFLTLQVLWLACGVQSSSQKLVALLGIAQRHVHVSRAHIPTGCYRRKPLPTNIQTLGDLIQVKRHEKKPTRWHLASKMGIATLTVRGWEFGTSQPDQRQLAHIEKILDFKAETALLNAPK